MTDRMTDSDYDLRARGVFERLEAALEASDADLDWDSPAQGVIEITFANGSQMVVNRQNASQEIWLASRGGGYHFRWRDGAWRDTRDDSELFGALAREALAQAGEELAF